jgi:peroxiredoxin Q/BCP
MPTRTATPVTPAATSPEHSASPGRAAPAFDLDSDSGKRVTLAEFAGKWLVIYFYPKDDTPGCTREAQAFTAAASRLAKLGAEVVGISRDSVKSHCGFRDKYKINYALLSDPDLSTHRAYGAWGQKTMYGKKVEGVIRSTFLVSPEGKVARAWSGVKVDGHVDKVIDALKTARETDAAEDDAGRTSASAKSSAKKARA